LIRFKHSSIHNRVQKFGPGLAGRVEEQALYGISVKVVISGVQACICFCKRLKIRERPRELRFEIWDKNSLNIG
jgi:hypothetical protein